MPWRKKWIELIRKSTKIRKSWDAFCRRGRMRFGFRKLVSISFSLWWSFYIGRVNAVSRALFAIASLEV